MYLYTNINLILLKLFNFNYKMDQKFKELNIPIPDNVFNKNIETQESVYEYIKQMNNINKKTYLIAMDHLGTSFNIIKSNGYIDWKKKQK